MHIKDILNWLPENRVQKKEHENAVKKLMEYIKTQHTNYRKEIEHWRRAQFAAKNPEQPRRKYLIDFYEEITDDAFLFGRMETRTLRVSNKEFSIETNGEINEEKTQLLQKGWFRQFIKYTLEANYYGYTLPFFKDMDSDGMVKSIDMVYRDHIVPETCQILSRLEDAKGIDFTLPPYNRHCIFINNKHSLGLLNKAIPLYIFKKHSWQNWDEFEEKFGIPLRIIKTASTDPRVLREIDKWLKELGSAGRARFPEGTDVEIKESSTTDSFQVFNEKRKACNEEIATLFDGHMETAKDAGSRAKTSSLIESTQDLITLDDALFVKNIINDLLIPKLIELGYPFTSDDVFTWNENAKLTPKERLAIFQGVQSLGYTVKKEQIESELDVEIEEKPPINTNDPNNGIANFNTPHSVTSCGAHPIEYRIAVYNMDYELSDSEKKLLRSIANGNVTWSYNEFKHHHSKLLQGLREGVGFIDTSFDADGHKMQNTMRASVHRFGFDKTVAEIFQLNEVLRTSRDFSEFRERALSLFPNYKLHWLRTEYQQAFAAGQMGARWQEMLEDIDIAPYWRYSAILDDRVRPEHRALHGKVFRKDDAEAGRFLPPIGFNCRCDALDELDNFDGTISTIDDAISSDPDLWEQMQKTGHDVNWGNTGQVFSATQSYLRKVRANNINYTDLSASDFNLKDSFNSNEKLIETAFKWSSKLDENGNLKLMDVADFPVWSTQQLLRDTPDFLVNQLQQVLAVPDEIYHFVEGNTMVNRYVKYYKDTAIAVRTEFNRNQPSFITSIDNDAQINNLREGLLIYNRPDTIDFEKQVYNEAVTQLDLRKEKGFNETSGGWYVTEKGHGKNEVTANVALAKRLSQRGDRVILNKVTNDKTFDGLWNEKPVEFKSKSNYTNLKNSLYSELKKANKQASNVLIELNGYYNKSEIIEAITSIIKNNSRGGNLKQISLLLPNDQLITFTRSEVFNGSFKNLL